jgi:HlyD family secretion protein
MKESPPITCRAMDHAIHPAQLRRRSRQQAIAGILLLAGVCAAAWGINRVIRPSVASADIVVAQVRRGNVDNTIEAAGVVIPVHEEVVSSPGASRIARVHAKPGQQVRAGELLLELDDRTIRLALEALKEQLAQQDNRVVTLRLEMEQKLKQTASAIELLEIDLQAARVRHERNQKLRTSGIVSGEDLMTAELNVRRAGIGLRQQRELLVDTRRGTASAIAAAGLQQAILQKQIVQQEVLLAQTRVCAPFAGMLTFLVEEAGASVAAGQLVARVAELNNYRVEATLSDFHASLLASGQAVHIVQNGASLDGTIHTVLPEIQNGTIKLLVDLARPHDAMLRNKMRVDVHVVTARRTNVLVLDSVGAFNGRGAQEAFAVRDAVATKTMLTLGAGDGKVVEVAKGAREGDAFIVSSTSSFKDHATFRITP